MLLTDFKIKKYKIALLIRPSAAWIGVWWIDSDNCVVIQPFPCVTICIDWRNPHIGD